MKRQQIKALPVMKLKTRAKTGNYVKALIHGDTLVLDCYKDRKYIARYLLDSKGNYGEFIDDKWKSKKLISLYCSYWYWWTQANAKCDTETDAYTIKDLFLAKYYSGYKNKSWAQTIDSIESRKNAVSRSKAYENKKKRISEEMSKIKPLPGDFKQWCFENVFKEKHYAFKTDKKDVYYCTACGKTHSKKGLKDKQTFICNRSGKEVLCYKRSGNRGEEKRVMVLQRIDPSKSVARHLKVSCTWEQARKNIEVFEEIRYVFTTTYMCQKLKIYYGQWNYRDQFSQEWWNTNPANKRALKCFCYPKGAEDALKGSVYNNLGIPVMAEKGWELNYNAIMANYYQTSCYEYLAKCGFENIATDEAEKFSNWGGYYSHTLNIRGENANEILRINTQRINRLKAKNGGSAFLEWLQLEEATGKKVTDEAISFFDKNSIKPYDVEFITDRMSGVQIANYLMRQREETKEKVSKILTTWKDYLSMAKKFNFDVNDEIVFRCKKLFERHAQLIELSLKADLEKEAKKLEKSFKKVKSICKQIKGKFEWSGEEYTVIVPDRIKDILLEGRMLHHCVGSSDRYYERIENNEAYILFLRKNAAPNNPWYTLEVEPDGTVRQKRTMYDRQNPDLAEAKEFLLQWQKVVAKRLKAEDVELAKKSKQLRKDNLKQLRKENKLIWHGELAGKPLADVLEADLMENSLACNM